MLAVARPERPISDLEDEEASLIRSWSTDLVGIAPFLQQMRDRNFISMFLESYNTSLFALEREAVFGTFETHAGFRLTL